MTLLDLDPVAQAVPTPLAYTQGTDFRRAAGPSRDPPHYGYAFCRDPTADRFTACLMQ